MSSLIKKVTAALILMIAGPAGWCVDDSIWKIYDELGRKAYREQDLDKAAKLLNEAVKEAEKLGPRDPRLSRSLQSLGEVYRAMGKTSEAKAVSDRLLGLSGGGAPAGSKDAREPILPVDPSAFAPKESTKVLTPGSENPPGDKDRGANPPGAPASPSPDGEKLPVSSDAPKAVPAAGASEDAFAEEGTESGTGPDTGQVNAEPAVKTEDLKPQGQGIQTGPSTPASHPVEPLLRESAPASGRIDELLRPAEPAKTDTATQSPSINIDDLLRPAPRSPADASAAVRGEVREAEEIRRLNGHINWVKSIQFSADGRRAISGSEDHTVRFWSLDDGQCLLKMEGHLDSVNSVCMSKDMSVAVSGSNDLSVRLWDLKSGAEVRRFKGHVNIVSSVALSPDGTKILSGSYDETARLWNRDDGSEMQRLKGHEDTVRGVAFSPDGKQALTASSDQTVRLWDLATGQEIKRLEGHTDQVLVVTFAPDGRHAASGGKDLKIRIWDLASGRQIAVCDGHRDWINCLQYMGDERLMSGSLDKTMCLWDTATGSLIRQYTIDKDGMWSVGFSSDGSRALTGSDDKSLRYWKLD